MTDEQALELLEKLDDIASGYDHTHYGLPLVDLNKVDRNNYRDRAAMKLIECVKSYVAELKQ